MGSIGFPEMIVIFVVALLVFGPKRLPELGRSLGRGLTEFRRASSDLKSSMEREIQSLELEDSVKEFRQTSTDLKNTVQGEIHSLDLKDSMKDLAKLPEETKLDAPRS